MTKFIEHRTVRRAASKDIVVLYHAECTDGFGAAWAAYKTLGTTADYHPVVYQTPPPDGLVGKTIYTLDFTYSRPVMEKLIRDNKQVTALDHHVTARETTELTHDFRYALDHSGAMLAWEYFHPGVPPPYLIRIIEDTDLHRYAIADSVTLSDWLDQFDFEFKLYSKMARTLDSASGVRRALRQGVTIRAYREKLVERMVKNTSYEVEFLGHRVLAVTAEQFHSEIGNELAKDHPFGVTWRVRRDGVCVSLRSAPGGINVAEIALRYGGGGHEHAAGFTVPTLDDLPFTQVQSSER